MSSAKKEFLRPTSSNGLPEKRKALDMSNKTFFTNIKAELSSIRTDVNKLVSNKEAPNKWATQSKTINLNQSAKEVGLEKKNSDLEQAKKPDQEMVKKFSSQIN